MAYPSYVLAAAVFVIWVECTVPFELDNAPGNTCSSPTVQKYVRNCYTALVETYRQVLRNVDGRTSYCCRLLGIKICLTSVLDHYGCNSETNPDQQVLNLMFEALDQSPCKTFDLRSCESYLQHFQVVFSDLHSDPYDKTHRESRTTNSTELATNGSTSNVNDDTEFFEFTTVEDKKFDNLTTNGSLETLMRSQDMFDVDWQVLRRIIVVVSDKSRERVFLFKLVQEYDGSFKTFHLPVEGESLPKVMEWSTSSKLLVIDPKGHNSTSIMVSKSSEEATVLLADYVKDSHNFSNTNSSLGDARQPKFFKWGSFFNSTTTNMKSFMKNLNESIYKILSGWRDSSTSKSLNLTEGNSKESERDFMFVIPVETDNWPEVITENQKDGSNAVNSNNTLSNRTEHGRAVITIATMPPFIEDESMSDISESPDPVIMFFGIWPPETPSSRDVELQDHQNDTPAGSRNVTVINETTTTNSSKRS